MIGRPSEEWVVAEANRMLGQHRLGKPHHDPAAVAAFLETLAPHVGR